MIIVNAGLVNADEVLTLFREMPKAAVKIQHKVTDKYGSVMRAIAVEETTDRYYVKKSKLLKEIRIDSTSNGVKLEVRGRRHSLASYKLSPKRPPKSGKPYTIKVAVRKDGGLKPLTGLQNKPFLMPNRSGGFESGYVPVVRAGRERLPLVSVMSPAYSQLVKWAESHGRKIEERTKEALQADFDQYIRELAR